ncbi:IS21 family transposase [Pelotomaculum isophthalicicum JI]|uniref:IS21 family transposase n=1 Tax=Pelotomaculum isophthalicicum JI TaxID=947010 RepID=A0A9X4JWX1_9FIRM|nr:IS21 family transposase [Pelotomaculum isophthalicicum]MDF9410093.1 IS21 family transposase [Pelotomaculum isophthalicicum JI]
MLKAKEILRLKHEVGLSLREIGKSCNCGKTTVSEVIERANNAGITWPIELNDKQLLSLLYPPANNKNTVPEPDMEYVFYEMKKKSVTLMLLWEEYKEKHPNGIMYTQFCERYRKFKKANQLTMHIEHKAGEEMQVDWAGQTMSYVEPETGEIKTAYLFVAVLPASAYPFVHAYGDTKLPNWIDAHVRAYEYFGGVPKVTIPDNTKTAVITPDRVDPVLNKSYNEMARHYHTTLVPARAGKPKDKAAGENIIGNVSRRIIAALRNRQFFSLYEINQSLREELAKFIQRPFQKMEGNRLTAFEKIDKLFLQPLPSTRYEFADWKETKVQFNYHAEYDGFFYSVHYSYVGQPCSVRATSKTIEIYIAGERVAAYPRNYNRYKRYTTQPEHMPEEHKVVSGWSSERFLSWAKTIGPYTRELIKSVLESREYPVQTYRACMGIIRLSKSYTPEALEKASQEALAKRTYSYKYFSIILKQVTAKAAETKAEKIIQHANVRGSRAYAGGGIHA